MAILIALALLLLVVKLAGAYNFWSALAVGYGIWLFIDWYDCFFLDMTALFVCISIPLMEKRQLQKKPGYAEYRKQTRMFI
ncbi:MAG: hypothetical protein IKU03_08515 [Bacteroidales bacterium]|nr:hypothetical protein [Bacteroidales bacterium]